MDPGRWWVVCMILVVGLGHTGPTVVVAEGVAEIYRSPYDVAFSPDGKWLGVSDRTGGVVTLMNRQDAGATESIELNGEPTGLAWSTADSRLYVAEFDAGTVAEIDPKSRQVMRRLKVGQRPLGLALAPKRGLLLAANSATHTVSVVDLKLGQEVNRISTAREPFAIAVTPDESRAVVTNLLPAGRATSSEHASVVTILDLERRTSVGEVRLPPGSSSLRDVAISPDGRWAYVVHTVGRTNLPTTQLERGWVNTNAMSIIDLAASTLYATVLLDHPMEGAANPWGLALSGDGRTIWVSISGVHWLARIDLHRLHRYMAGELEETHRLAQTGNSTAGTESIWLRIRRDPDQRRELVNDLAALHAAELIERVNLPVRGPRGLDISPDGKTIAAAGYYSAEVAMLDTVAHREWIVPLGPSRKPDQARRGEIIFHDATSCFQNWLSCSTCHPRNGRVDALNWDILNDGIGNPKNVKSLLGAHQTPPMTWRGVRPSMDVSVEKGFYFLMRQPTEGEVEAVRAYLRSLTPRPSPHLGQNGELTDSARRGQEIFTSRETMCANCHRGELMTDLKQHKVGTRGSLDKSSQFDTPSLVELYATGPFLHDGSAATLHELIERNSKDRHGKTSHLSPQQIEDLIAYLLSL